MNLLAQFTRFKVNNGDCVQFWTNPRCSSLPLSSIFPDLFNPTEGKSDSVKNHMIRSRAFCTWNVRLRRNLNDWEIDDMGRLLDILENCSLGNSELEDERVWVPDAQNGFLVRSIYLAMTHEDSPQFPTRLIWHSIASTKISFFLCLLW